MCDKAAEAENGRFIAFLNADHNEDFFPAHTRALMNLDIAVGA